ncbi:hypothetical protein M446_4504 [Methylobacterium sp. 4-46]|uniref:hypothetical protein n=1 Tax=unclassified Methylobacterium TaxID=2615210 RepID=UPI000165CD81|nr:MULTISPECIES: hypothetical protein [Methylobacterium]ACA18845.1 hypothetical protein M446_4504 [Methylobacterium sp. 4-46]WFT78070.1 hypothetical protein QA634_22600 [Methylobacterium nodulans]
MTRLAPLLRCCAAALLGLAALLLAASTASAAPVGGGPVMRAVTPEMIDASLHADLPAHALRCIASVSAPAEPIRPSDDGAQGASPVATAAPGASASTVILPPRDLGSRPPARAARLDRPPKAA